MSKIKALFMCFVWSLFTIGAWLLTSWAQGNSFCVGVALVPTTIALVYGCIAVAKFSRDARIASAALAQRYIPDPDSPSEYDGYGEYGAAAPHTTPGSGWIGLPDPHESH